MNIDDLIERLKYLRFLHGSRILVVLGTDDPVETVTFDPDLGVYRIYGDYN